MKKILENKPRLVFWVGFVVVFILFLGALTIQLNQVPEDKKSGEDLDVITEAAVPDPKEVEFALNHNGAEGEIVSLNNNLLIIKNGNENLELKITEKTSVFKGVQADKASLTDLRPGLKVTVVYNNKNLEVVSIFTKDEGE